jgi:class 3 adenylate cyclase
MAREQRKLAAILAADVVGYSRPMERDESGTLARRRISHAGRRASRQVCTHCASVGSSTRPDWIA